MGEGVLSEKSRDTPAETLSAASMDALLADAGLVRRGRALVVGTGSPAVSLSAVARAVDTPTYLYNADVIRARYRALDAALAPVSHRICYAVKANSNLAVLRILAELGAGADIVSGGELARVLAAGFSAEQVVFSGVGKTAAELRAAVRARVGQVNVESREELALLGDIAGERQQEVAVGIRVNPDITAETHPYISTGARGIKFGIPLDQVLATAEFVARHPWLRLEALAMHLGSQLVDVRPYEEGICLFIHI
jgi:diaminopimelate decarboxylase